MVLKCKKCGVIFQRRILIKGKVVDLGHNRAHCPNCYPYKIRKPINRICKKCGDTFPPTAFINGSKKVLTSRKYCLKCSPFKKRIFCGPKVSKKITNRKTCWSSVRRKKLKIQAINYKGGNCIKCGYNKNFASMIFHHKEEANKEFQIGGNIMSWDIIKKELDKCELLCANCHGEYHYPECILR